MKNNRLDKYITAKESMDHITANCITYTEVKKYVRRLALYNRKAKIFKRKVIETILPKFNNTLIIIYNKEEITW